MSLINITSQKCFVLIRNKRKDGFVEFDFSINDPELYVELILPEAAFKEFCNSNQVNFLSEEDAKKIDRDKERWRNATAVELQ